jgi:membrane protein
MRFWRGVLTRTVREFRADHLTDWAAALTYYAVLSIFPALIGLVALLGLFGEYPRTSDAVLGIIDKIGPSSAVDLVRGAIEGVVKSKGDAGALLGVGLLGALWSASGYVGVFMRASNAIYEVEEGRPFWKLRPLQVLVTLACVILVALVAVSLVVTGALARAIGDAVGVGGTAVTIWNIAKWPVLVLVVMTIFAILYYTAPNVRLPGFRWITPGGVVGVLLWIVASAGFALYVANLGSYNETYGSLGGTIVFLVWVWISNLALLFGAELNAELERGRELERGLPAERELQLQRRSEKKKPEQKRRIGRRA